MGPGSGNINVVQRGLRRWNLMRNRRKTVMGGFYLSVKTLGYSPCEDTFRTLISPLFPFSEGKDLSQPPVFPLCNWQECLKRAETHLFTLRDRNIKNVTELLNTGAIQGVSVPNCSGLSPPGCANGVKTTDLFTPRNVMESTSSLSSGVYFRNGNC